jgi:hypothetical protein
MASLCSLGSEIFRDQLNYDLGMIRAKSVVVLKHHIDVCCGDFAAVFGA